ncbi:efflux RND transporter permease subunit [Stappia indica]|uniref:efflux RND transporter permease subunit n=1 Tax=Stappia indica TaxID=538381 RepID=UPI0008368B2C|nr:efflux RND transporter permease subunit [Stappia indica]
MASRVSPGLRFFFLNTTFGIVLLAIFVIGGWLSFTTMTRENYPDLAIPQATVLVEWPGASPGQIEEELAKPLETSVRAIPGLRSYASSSQNSALLISVEFEAEVDLDTAMRNLRTKVEEARSEFPQQARTPEVQQVSVNDAPILTYAILGEVDEDTLVRSSQALVRDLERVPGVRKASLQGARDRAVFIQLDPARLRSLGLSPVDVRQRIEVTNQDLAWGNFNGQTATLPLYLEGRFRDLDEVRDVIVARLGDNRTVRLSEVADVFIGLTERDRATQVSTEGKPFLPALTLSVLKRPGGDTLAVIDEVRTRIDAYTASAAWPMALKAVEIASEGTLIEASFNEVTSNLGQGIVAVFLILLVALTWREAIVAAIALPVAMLSALIALNVFGYTLNTLIILGAVIALGLIVDVFILVMEGMHDALYVRKLKFNEAALDTVKSFALPALAGQATTILAMVPLLMISGIDGKFIRQIPLSAIACLVTSVVVAFLICIPLSRYLLGGTAEPKPTAIDRISERASGALNAFLQRWPLRGRWTAAGIVAAAFLGLLVSLDAAARLPQVVYPPEDRRNIGVTILLRPDAPLADTERLADAAGDVLRAQPWIENVNLHAGEASPFALQTLADNLVETSSPNILGISVRLRAREDREQPSWELTETVRELLAPIVDNTAGATLRLSPDLGGASSADPIQIEVTGQETHELRDIARALSGVLEVTPGVTDIRDNLGAFRTEVRFNARPEALSFYGIGEDTLMEQIRIAMTADKIGTFSMPGTEPDLDIRLGTDFPSQDGIGGPREISELETMTVVTPDGERVPMNNLVASSLGEVPSSIVHTSGQRGVTVSARTTTDTPALGAIEQLRPQIEEMAANWPAGVTWRFRGEAESSAETFGSVGIALMVAVGLVFAVLALVFQSFLQPFIIMTLAPLSLIGVFGGFALLGIPVSFPAMIGIIALVGIIVNNGIVIVQVTNGHLANGVAVAEAAARGAAERLRPILTTSITTVVGLVPLALSSPAWYPLCMAIILGLAVGTILSLVVVPVLYLLMTRRSTSDAPRSGAPASAPQGESHA